MADVISTDSPTLPTAQRILVAARAALLESGFSALSTRSVAVMAGVPLSQIHYHFGSKEQLILAMLREENEALVHRQADMFHLDVSLGDRWRRACDYLDDDINSGYVRVLQEMIAAGWSSTEVRNSVSELIGSWTAVLSDVVEQARDAGVAFGPFSAEEVVALIASVFYGAESMLLLGLDPDVPVRTALRGIGDLLDVWEPSG